MFYRRRMELWFRLRGAFRLDPHKHSQQDVEKALSAETGAKIGNSRNQSGHVCMKYARNLADIVIVNEGSASGHAEIAISLANRRSD